MRNSGALVVGYRKGDPRRYVQRRTSEARAKAARSGLWLPGTVEMERHELDCHTIAGRCIGCNQDVYVNSLGMSAVREKDADVCCLQCETNYGADLTNSI